MSETGCIIVRYCIAEKFRGRKLSQIDEKYDFCGESFHGLLAFGVPKKRHAPKFRGENFCEQPQKHEIRKSFLPRKFSAIWYQELYQRCCNVNL